MSVADVRPPSSISKLVMVQEPDSGLLPLMVMVVSTMQLVLVAVRTECILDILMLPLVPTNVGRGPSRRSKSRHSGGGSKKRSRQQRPQCQ